jgi:hypothetical protein
MGRGKDLQPRKSGAQSAYGKTNRAVAIVDPSAKEFILQFVEKLEKECAENLTEHFDKTSARSSVYRISPWEIAREGFGYIRNAINANQPLTLSGMALSFGMTTGIFRTDRDEENEYKFVRQRLRGFIEMYNETALSIRQNPVGAIFVLKNMGWKDTFDVNVRPILPMTEEERAQAKARIKNFSE